MKYPFSPEVLDALPEELAELFRSLEITLLEEVCSRLNIADNLNEVAVQDIKALRSHGIGIDEIKKAIKDTTGISNQKLNALLQDVVDRNQAYYTELIDLARVTTPETIVDASTVAAIAKQTKDTFKNLTASMGFLVDSGRTMLKPAQAYQWALDNALLQVKSGAISYGEAIARATKQLADSGLKSVDYESGHVDQIDVAVRRAVMTGISQVCDAYTDQSAEYLDSPYVEVSAHAGARDKPYPNPWSSHKAWQGKVYYQSKNGESDPLGKYPNLVNKTGYGYVDGLCGANCRHKRFVWVEGVSERTYTDDQLENIDKPPFKYEGQEYTTYDATQKQREIERTIRKLKREETAYKAAGLKGKATATRIRIRRLTAKYHEFSKAAGLREQPERMKVIKT